jgi:hypothetical protein
MENIEKTIRVSIFIAGDYLEAKKICRIFTMEYNTCVNLKKVDYIYNGGAEEGVEVMFLNYPKRPDTLETLRDQAFNLASLLLEGLCQYSFSIVDEQKTLWVDIRKNKEKKS